ncbi:MAG: GIY-YIG nuclease family protein [Verrucomicrobia subdivision 3 bacterium]|nr:GIY-YIG nuclease family protein [Limisphaerales bacterium]
MKVQGFVYFIRGGDLVKIGWSTNPRLRLSQLQTASAERLRIIGVTPGTRGDERALHGTFASLRVRGEWFRACPGLLAAVPWICDRSLERLEAAGLSEAQRWVDALRGCLAVMEAAADDLVEEQVLQVKRGLTGRVHSVLELAVSYSLATDPQERDQVAREIRSDFIFDLAAHAIRGDRPDVPGANGSSDEIEALS